MLFFLIIDIVFRLVKSNRMNVLPRECVCPKRLKTACYFSHYDRIDIRSENIDSRIYCFCSGFHDIATILAKAQINNHAKIMLF
jgi:hypothetical protein